MKHLLLTLIILGATAPVSAAPIIGEVITLHGEAVMTRGKLTKPLQVHETIQSQDLIATEQSSHAIILFKDGSKLTVGSNSNIIIDEFVFDPTTLDGSSAIQVRQGFFRFIGGQLKDKKTTIKTPVSTIGIRGTELFGEVESTGVTSVALVECCVDISNDAGTVALEEAGTYSLITAKDSKPGDPIVCDMKWVEKTAKMLGLTPADLNY